MPFLQPLPAPGGVVLRGRVVTGWGPGDEEHEAGEVVVRAGRVQRVGPRGTEDPSSSGLPVLEGVVVPALVDAHVHLAFGGVPEMLAGGVAAVRDLGAPLADALRWRARPPSSGDVVVAVAGPLLTAPGGYPTRGWGAGGFGLEVEGPRSAADAVARLVAAGVDVVKLALEPAAGPVPSPATTRAVVDAAHAAGLAVTCHALTPAMVLRALDAGVDELCHVPTAPLPPSVVARLAASGTPVVSTLLTHARTAAPANAAALVAEGVPLVYGTDLGNAGTVPGADVGELELLAAAGLGLRGALLAATQGAASVPGLRGVAPARLRPGDRVAALVLDDHPVARPAALARPRAVVVHDAVHVRPEGEP